MIKKPGNHKPLPDFTMQDFIDRHDTQYDRFLKMTVLAFELKKLGEESKSFDLFDNAARAFSTHAMMTLLGIIITDQEMKWTSEQTKELGVYLNGILPTYTKFRDRANAMAEVFIKDDLQDIVEEFRSKKPKKGGPK